MAVLWLALATLILIGTYLSLPVIANHTLSVIQAEGSEQAPSGASAKFPVTDTRSTHTELYTVGILGLSLFAVCFACFLLGRTAFVEIELAARFLAFADALCLAGQSFDQLEKIANLLLPGTKYLSVPDIFSVKDLDSVVEIVKQLRPK